MLLWIVYERSVRGLVRSARRLALPTRVNLGALVRRADCAAYRVNCARRVCESERSRKSTFDRWQTDQLNLPPSASVKRHANIGRIQTRSLGGLPVVERGEEFSFCVARGGVNRTWVTGELRVSAQHEVRSHRLVVSIGARDGYVAADPSHLVAQVAVDQSSEPSRVGNQWRPRVGLFRGDIIVVNRNLPFIEWFDDEVPRTRGPSKALLVVSPQAISLRCCAAKSFLKRSKNRERVAAVVNDFLERWRSRGHEVIESDLSIVQRLLVDTPLFFAAE